MRSGRLVAAALLVLFAEAVSAKLGLRDWHSFRGDGTRSGYARTEHSLRPPLKLDWTALQGDPAVADTNVIIEASPIIEGDRVFVATYRDLEFDSGFDSSVVCFSLQSGELLWKQQLGDQGIWSTPAVDGNGRIFAADFGGTVYALNTVTGALLWQQQVAPAGAERAFRASPLVDRGRVYVIPYLDGAPTSLYALDAATGTIIKQVALAGSAYASPMTARRRLYVALQLANGTSRLEAYSLNPLDSLNRLWSVPIQEDYAATTPAYLRGRIIYRSGTYQNQGANRVHVFDAISGRAVRTPYQLPADSYYYSSPAVARRTVYVATMHALYALDQRRLLSSAGTDPLQWVFRPADQGDGGQIASSPAVANGHLYLSTDDLSAADGRLYALDERHGGVVWSYGAINGVGSAQTSPAISDGKVLFASYDSNSRLYHGLFAFSSGLDPLTR